MTFEFAVELFLSGAFVSGLMHAIAIGFEKFFTDDDAF
jgi:hypothetical protein